MAHAWQRGQPQLSLGIRVHRKLRSLMGQDRPGAPSAVPGPARLGAGVGGQGVKGHRPRTRVWPEQAPRGQAQTRLPGGTPTALSPGRRPPPRPTLMHSRSSLLPQLYPAPDPPYLPRLLTARARDTSNRRARARFRSSGKAREVGLVGAWSHGGVALLWPAGRGNL